ncbi:MAG: 5'-deoxyadenosine deaminase [Dehalococcoidia bacterium]|nr:5'-deoxyadenosine deaminase [Bacillota bacterium]
MQIITLSEETTINYGALWNGIDTKIAGPGTLFTVAGFITDKPGCQATSLDFSHLTLMPAMVDCHVHLAMPYKSGDSLAVRVNKMLMAGVAAVREAGSRDETFFSDPRLLIANCCRAISKKGYYGSNVSKEVSSLTEALAEIKRLASQGAQHLKLITSDIFSFSQYGQTGPLPFSQTELITMTELAKKLGLAVMAHASGDEAVRRCIAAGVNSIEHGYFMQEDTLPELIKHDIAWVPTLTPVEVHLSNPELYSLLSPSEKNTISRSLERQIELVGLGGALGIRIGAGTDAGGKGVPHGSSLIKEIKLLRQAGLSGAQALKAATSEAAKICVFKNIGIIHPGYRALLLAVRGNPLMQPEILEEPEALLLY